MAKREYQLEIIYPGEGGWPVVTFHDSKREALDFLKRSDRLWTTSQLNVFEVNGYRPFETIWQPRTTRGPNGTRAYCGLGGYFAPVKYTPTTIPA